METELLLTLKEWSTPLLDKDAEFQPLSSPSELEPAS